MTSNTLVGIADRLKKVGEQSISKESADAYNNAKQIIDRYELAIGKQKQHTYTMLTSSKSHKIQYHAPQSTAK